MMAILTALALAALVFFVACGGDDDEGEEEDSEPTATEESNGDSEDEGDEEATPDSGDGGEDGSSGLSAASAEYSDFQGVVKYETSEFAGETFTTMTIYRGDGGSRVDYEGESGSGSFITNSEGSFACSEEQCVRFPIGQGIDPTAAFTAFINPENIADTYGNLPDGVNVEESSEQIAGLDATCYEYSGELDDSESGDETGQICFSESGILLRLDFTGTEGGGKFEAVEAEEGTSDTDFEPPYPVVDLLGQ
jgi:hypothetical protein